MHQLTIADGSTGRQPLGRYHGYLNHDLLIAATAERERLIVLCDDHDYQTVATVTGQPVKLVTDI